MLHVRGNFSARFTLPIISVNILGLIVKVLLQKVQVFEDDKAWEMFLSQ